MKALSLALFALSLLVIGPETAQAQVDQGDLRLFFDTGLVSYTMGRVKADSALGDYKDSDNNLSIGPGLVNSNSGIGFAYAASKHVLPGLYLNFARTRLSGELDNGRSSNDKSETTFTELELRPQVELTLQPNRRFVPYGSVGLSYVYRSANVDNGPGQTDSSSFGIGPVVGVGAHAFAASTVSFDFGLTFRALFVNDDDRKDALEGAGLTDVKQREYAILFNLGASYWL